MQCNYNNYCDAILHAEIGDNINRCIKDCILKVTN